MPRPVLTRYRAARADAGARVTRAAGAACLALLTAAGLAGCYAQASAGTSIELATAYVPLPAAYQTEQLERGEADFSLHFAAPTIMAIDAGKPITVIAGIHAGCFERSRPKEFKASST